MVVRKDPGYRNIRILLIAKNITAQSLPKPLVPLMRFFDRHHFKNSDNLSGQNIKKAV